MSATSRWPDSGERLAIVIAATPAWASATAITRASRPAPMIIARWPANVDVSAHQIHQRQAFGVVAQQPRAVGRDAVDRPAEPGPVGQLVEVFEHGHLMRLGDLDAAEAQRPDAAHRVAELLPDRPRTT